MYCVSCECTLPCAPSITLSPCPPCPPALSERIHGGGRVQPAAAGRRRRRRRAAPGPPDRRVVRRWVLQVWWSCRAACTHAASRLSGLQPAAEQPPRWPPRRRTRHHAPHRRACAPTPGCTSAPRRLHPGRHRSRHRPGGASASGQGCAVRPHGNGGRLPRGARGRGQGGAAGCVAWVGLVGRFVVGELHAHRC